jgi:thiol-disulfide isomerase/thioredoxin
MFRRSAFAMLLCWTTALPADQPGGKTAPPEQQVDAGENPPPQDTPPAFELTEEVRDALVPLFSTIAKAEVSRATVEMLVDSLVGGSVVESQKSTYQIASIQPDKFTVYLKEPEQRTRIYCDGKSMAIALAPDAYFRLPEAMSMQDAVTNSPIPLGPYPEPALALTLAGVDPAISLVGGMKSIELVDRDDFRGQVPAVHLRGVQADAVTWDFWIASGDQPRPLRFLVDLTPMLMASDQLQIPAGYSYQVRFDFVSWRMTGEVDEKLFTYTPSKDAKEYKSLEDYYESVAGVVGEHPLLGKPAPAFQTEMLDGSKLNAKDLAGKVVVLDFWATWCAPCVAAMPILKGITDEYADKDVVFLAINTGEERKEIEEFLQTQKIDVNVALDPDGKIADAFVTEALPQTVVIGKSGEIESVHIGFLGDDALKQRLKDELDVLCAGGKIGSLDTEATTDGE